MGSLADYVITSGPTVSWVDGTLTWSVGAFFVGILAAYLGEGFASLFKGHNRGLVLVEMERLIRSPASWVLLLVVGYVSRIAAVVTLAAGALSLWTIRSMAREERWRLTDIFTRSNRDRH